MKFHIRLALCLIASVLACSCSDRHKGPPVIGISLPTQREERWRRDGNRLSDEAVKRGFRVEMRISENNAATQEQQCRELIERKVDVLILAPHDAKAAAAIVNYANDRKVKVIAYDRLVLDSKPDFYVAFDNEKIGQMQGEYLASKVPAGSYVFLSGAPTDNNSGLLKKGAMKRLGPLVESGAIKVVVDKPVEDWSPEYAREIAEDALVATAGRIDAVLAPNDATAGAVIEALARYKLDGKVVVTGHDAELAAVWRLLRGTQGMTVLVDTRQLASAAIEAAADIIAGRQPHADGKINNGFMDVESRLLAPVLVTKENINATLIDTGYFNKEAVYGDKFELEL
ncbi:MAG: sugar ABC transporter substrate-binding protein [Elusimicrobia bacterium]|nr:sugar ABC transporter substrate-binding protein [Elusimicrobiota bacterium]